MRTPAGKTIIITFHSHQLKLLEMWWKAQITFVPDAGPDTMLGITVVDGNDKPVQSAVFELAGRKLRIRDGRGGILYSDFVKGKHEKSIWLYRKGMPPVPGALTFA